MHYFLYAPSACASQGYLPPFSLNTELPTLPSKLLWVLFVGTRISLHQYCAWKTARPSRIYSMSPPLVTFPHSSRMNWASRELCSGGRIALAIYLLAYLSLPDCDGLPPQTQANVKNHLGSFYSRDFKICLIPGDSGSTGLGWNWGCWITNSPWIGSGDQSCVRTSS